jgi:hypothetical protein
MGWFEGLRSRITRRTLAIALAAVALALAACFEVASGPSAVSVGSGGSYGQLVP